MNKVAENVLSQVPGCRGENDWLYITTASKESVFGTPKCSQGVKCWIRMKDVMYRIHILLLLVTHLGCNHLSCSLSSKIKGHPMHSLMLGIWGVRVLVALGHSYLLAARLYSACCDAYSLLAAPLHHAGGPFPAPQGFSVVCFLQYSLQLKNWISKCVILGIWNTDA